MAASGYGSGTNIGRFRFTSSSPQERYDVKKPGQIAGSSRGMAQDQALVGLSFHDVMSLGDRLQQMGVRGIARSPRARSFFKKFWKRQGMLLRRIALPNAPSGVGKETARTKDRPEAKHPTFRSGLLRRVGSTSVTGYATGVKVKAGLPPKSRKSGKQGGSERQRSAGRYSHLVSAGIKFAGKGKSAERIPPNRWLWKAQEVYTPRVVREYLKAVEVEVQKAIDEGARGRATISHYFETKWNRRR